MSKEIIEYIINDLEKQNKIKWPSKDSKISKEKLIECWSEYREEPDWKWFGYSSHSSCCRIYKQIFFGVEKNNSRPWLIYILNLYGYKYCPKCKKLKLLEEFHNDRYKLDNKASKCIVCANKIKKIYDENNKEKIKEYCINNKNKINEYNKTYYINNKEYILQRNENWRIHNKEKCTARSAKYRSAKLNRTPIWSNLNKIKEFYLNCPKGNHIDHNIPLQGELVSGLHVPLNLQIISATENLSKSNKFNPDIWDEQIELKKLGFEYPKYIGD